MMTQPNPPLAEPRSNRFWLWLILIPPVAAILAGLYTVMLAFQHADPLVDDDYYKAGMAINQSLERSETAKRRQLLADVHYQSDSGEVWVVLTQAGQPLDAGSIRLNLSHPTRKEQDQQRVLTRDGQGHFRGQLPAGLQGNWYLQLSSMTPDWRLAQSRASRLSAEQRLIP